MPSSDATFFLTLAAIAGTLLGLSFVTLQLFHTKLIERYESTSLPVFRNRDFDASAQPWPRMNPPDSLKDEKLFDGDPLIIFMAFSVAVTWIQFLVPLTLGLTAVWLEGSLTVLAVELAIMLVFFGFSFIKRNSAIKRLKPYLTREEILWPVLGIALLALYTAAVAVTLVAALSPFFSLPSWFTPWNRWCVSNVQASSFALKTVCILSVLVGTYTTNKDMFIFFKSVAAERMRLRWLDSFIRERYQNLEEGIRAASAIGAAPARQAELKDVWEHPPLISSHESFAKDGQVFLAKIWQDLVARRAGTPIWLLDVPRIARWEARLQTLLDPAGADRSIEESISTASRGSRWKIFSVYSLLRDGLSRIGHVVGLVFKATLEQVAAVLAVDAALLAQKLRAVKLGTSLAKLRFGSPDYDNWALVYGRLETRKDLVTVTASGTRKNGFGYGESSPARLVCSGDAVVMFLNDDATTPASR